MAHPTSLCGLWPDCDNLLSPINVIDPQGHEFFSPQGCIVGKQDHGLSASIFIQENMAHQLFPHLVRRNPG
jgi:hypothetical protein